MQYDYKRAPVHDRGPSRASWCETLRLADVHAVLDALGELNGAGSEGEQGVVLADAHVVTGVDVRAALTDENLAGLHGLAAVALGAETLGVGITAVAGRAEALLVCHGGTCLLSAETRT